jgi:glycosyltransferase involved in cell wall biosynthesis
MNRQERKMTVVQMLPDLESGGVERGTLDLGRYLVRSGHRSLVISGGGRLVAQLEEEGSSHYSWRVGIKTPLTLRYLVALRRLLVREKVDILHLRSRVPAWLGYLAWRSLPVKTRPRLVTTFHGFYSINPYSAIMARGEKVIAVSKEVARHIMEEYGVAEERIAMIHRGVDCEFFAPGSVATDRREELRSLWDMPRIAPPVILLPGRITRLKGHEVFIKALARIAELPWLALCVGSIDDNPDYAAELRTLIRQCHLTDRVRLVGHCRDMPAALDLADLVVSATSSKPEAFGRVAVEAGAMARPVIATAHGGSLETVRPNVTGWLVQPDNVAAMADGLRQALADRDLLRQMGQNGRKWVLENFTVERMCRQTVDLYQQLLLSSE